MSWPTGNTGTCAVAGALMPMQNGQPLRLQVIGSDVLHVPLFSNKEAFDVAVRDGYIGQYDRLVQVQDPAEFLESFPPGIFIAFDMHRSPRGTVIYRVLDPKHPVWEDR